MGYHPRPLSLLLCHHAHARAPPFPRHAFRFALHHRSPLGQGRHRRGSLHSCGGQTRRARQSPCCPLTHLAHQCQPLPPRATGPPSCLRLLVPRACASPATPPAPAFPPLPRGTTAQAAPPALPAAAAGSTRGGLGSPACGAGVCWRSAACRCVPLLPNRTNKHNPIHNSHNNPSPFTPPRVASSPAPPVTKSGHHA